MYLGIDLGTSGVKVLVTQSHGKIVDSHSAPLSVSRPQPLWSEQQPQDWFEALDQCLTALSKRLDMQQIEAIGLAGQMHGATLIDEHNEVIRPAILWNDGRCQAQCEALETALPACRSVTGNIIMPGFTAPKVLWVKQNEPENFALIHKVLLPKDYLRMRLTGGYASDMSDAAGTMWLDVKKRQWYTDMLHACGLGIEHMPTLYEGNQITGYLTEDMAKRWGLAQIPVVAGGGDNAAGAIGVGMVSPGQGMLSLGTSGVYFLVTDGFHANPQSALHSFCHALPDCWHLMSVHLSAASCLQWFAESILQNTVEAALQELDERPDIADAPFFLPYLSGERTPHNNPHAQGSFFGLTHATNTAAMTHAVLEGVALAFADGVDAMKEAGVDAQEVTLIGGGAKSQYWRQMMADVLNIPMVFREGSDVGPALGAARLAQLAMQPQTPLQQICPVPECVEVHTPDPDRHVLYTRRRKTFQHLYQNLSEIFAARANE